MRTWILYAYDDPDDAPIYESFDEEDGEGPPTRKYAEEMFGGGVLYEYDLKRDSQGLIAVNPRLISFPDDG